MRRHHLLSHLFIPIPNLSSCCCIPCRINGREDKATQSGSAMKLDWSKYPSWQAECFTDHPAPVSSWRNSSCQHLSWSSRRWLVLAAWFVATSVLFYCYSLFLEAVFPRTSRPCHCAAMTTPFMFKTDLLWIRSATTFLPLWLSGSSADRLTHGR